MGRRLVFLPACWSCRSPSPGRCPSAGPCLRGSAWFRCSWAILSQYGEAETRPLRRGFWLGYVCGFLWYTGNCYWVRDTMAKYGDLPAIVPVLLLIGYSLVLGLYFGIFGLGVMLVRRATASTAGAGGCARFMGRSWSWRPRALPRCHGISWATRRWITRW